MERMIDMIRNRRLSASGMNSRKPLLTTRNVLLGKEADRGLIFRLFMYLILIDTAFIYIKPIIYMITTMVKDANNLLDPAVIWVPRSLFWGHLQEAFRSLKYPTAFTISMTVSLSVAVLQVISCSIAGYAFARLDFPLKRFWFVCLIFTFVMPPQVTILPSILLFKNFGWINTYLPMIIPAVFGHGLKGALFVIIFRQFFSTLPKELEEAAKIDGASVFRVFFRVMPADLDVGDHRRVPVLVRLELERLLLPVHVYVRGEGGAAVDLAVTACGIDGCRGGAVGPEHLRGADQDGGFVPHHHAGARRLHVHPAVVRGRRRAYGIGGIGGKKTRPCAGVSLSRMVQERLRGSGYPLRASDKGDAGALAANTHLRGLPF
ncbi:carbohydrate ABC transporter permease [Paenibacillus sp. P25]|nr:carbohydrate ABC transporter permease [Paenibacillus sp. P25]